MKKPTALAGFSLPLLFFFLLSGFGCKKGDELYTASFSIYVTATSPEQTTVNGAYDGNVTATLNRSADSSRFLVTLTLLKGDSAVQGTVNEEDSLVTFSPENELSPSSPYTATLTITEKGSSGRPYSYKWNFTTKAPDEYTMTQHSTHVTDFVRDGVMSMQLGNEFFTFGGWRDWPQSQNDVYRSSGDLSTWSRMPDAPWHPRHVFGCVKKDGKVWVMGGDNLNNTWDCWNSADGVNWTKVGATNPTPVGPRTYGGYCTHKIEGKEWLYIIGGYGYKDVLRSLDGITWETVANNVGMLGTWDEPNGANFCNAAVSFCGNLYLVCGGGGTAWGGRKEIYRSTDNGFTWQRMADFPGSQRRYTNVQVWDNKIWVIGGYDETTVGNLRDIWYMNEKGTWRQLQAPNDYVARHATALSVYNNKLVLACGDYNNDCWVIEKVK